MPKGVQAQKNPNSLNLIRFVCATFVLLSHLDYVRGDQVDRLRQAGVYSVMIFFGVSGYLLSQSLNARNDTRHFLRNRILRIFPGFLVSLLIVSFVFAPFYRLLYLGSSSDLFNTSMISYFLSNISTNLNQLSIDGTLQLSNLKNWNGPLWTLKFELLCYFSIFLIHKLIKKLALIASFGVFVTSIVVYLICDPNFSTLSLAIQTFCYFLMFFYFGVLLSSLKNYVKLIQLKVFVPLTIFTFFSLIATKDFGQNIEIAHGFFLIFLALVIGLNIKTPLFQSSDYSYGMYIYSMPITHLVLLVFREWQLSWLMFACPTFFPTLLFAGLSWHFVEKTAMQWKR